MGRSFAQRIGKKLPLGDAMVGAQLLWKLPGFLRHQISPEQAGTIVSHRMQRRQIDFLALAKRTVYGQATTSPYRRLLELAGCEYGDLERLVGSEGVEGALGCLFRQGVYLTVDEFKGLRPAVRGSATVEVRPEHLRNPAATIRIPRYTGGSRGPGAPAPFDLEHVRERAIGIRLYLDARGASRWRHATWEAPGGGTVLHLLEYSLVGAPMVRWFYPDRPRGAGLARSLSLDRPRTAARWTPGGETAAATDLRTARRSSGDRALDVGGSAGRRNPSPSDVLELWGAPVPGRRRGGDGLARRQANSGRRTVYPGASAHHP